MTKFKICGIRDAKHAVAASEAGADFLGFVFVEGVRRQLLEEQGKSIIDEFRALSDEGGPKLVGLFANQPLDFLNHVIKNCGLDFAQLCGNESLDFMDNVDVPVIRQIKVRDDEPGAKVVEEAINKIDAITSRGHMVLLDKFEAGALGGTGHTFDWSIAEEIARRHDILLAGGLSPDNVGEAIALVNPWGVDVSTGVESNGVKDESKIVSFAKAVRKASPA